MTAHSNLDNITDVTLTAYPPNQESHTIVLPPSPRRVYFIFSQKRKLKKLDFSVTTWPIRYGQNDRMDREIISCFR